MGTGTVHYAGGVIGKVFVDVFPVREQPCSENLSSLGSTVPARVKGEIFLDPKKKKKKILSGI